MGTITLIDYGAGNTQSVTYALQRLGIEVSLTSDPDRIRRAGRVIFPGVGQAASAVKRLQKNGLDKLIPELRQPVLGVCLGLQLMCRHTTEGDTPGMGIFDADVIHFHEQREKTDGLKIPHMGWNRVLPKDSLLLQRLPQGSYFYFVHSYFAEICNDTKGVAEYGIPFSAVMEKDNFFATQFHPEKSGDAGEQVLKNFLRI